MQESIQQHRVLVCSQIAWTAQQGSSQTCQVLAILRTAKVAPWECGLINLRQLTTHPVRTALRVSFRMYGPFQVKQSARLAHLANILQRRVLCQCSIVSVVLLANTQLHQERRRYLPA